MKTRLLSLFFYLCIIGGIQAQNAVPVDSIKGVLSQLPDKERLEWLDSLLQQNSLRPARLQYAQLLESEAKRQHNDEYLANAYYQLASHYYATNGDSLRYWTEQLVPIYKHIGRTSDLIRVLCWNVYQYSRESKYDEALNLIDEVRVLSKELSFPEGEEMADQSLADLYLSTGMAKEGEELYVAVLKRMEARNASLIQRVNILRQLFIRLSSPPKRLYYLNYTDSLINVYKAKGDMEPLGKGNPLYNLEFTLYRAQARDYLLENEIEKSWEAIEKAQKIVDTYQMARGPIEMAQIYEKYYSAVGNSEKTMEYIDFLEENYRKRKEYKSLYLLLERKAEIFLKQKQIERANLTLTEMLTLKDTIYTRNFDESIASLRTKYEVEKLEKEKQQYESEVERTKYTLLFSIIGSCVLVLVIIVLIWVNQTSRKSRRLMQEAKEKAEMADQMKTTFLANMNHEIRTPLNAIVGFSQVLVDEEDRDSRQEFANIIETNNELLQQLIGDVLDISKIESDSMRLNYTTQDMPLLMKDIYHSLRLRVTGSVDFILDPIPPFLFETDRNRLVQVITNLITNAIKHTTEGSIHFGYELLSSTIRFYVKDTGEGISDEMKISIFDRFVQLANGKKGVGLGLAICKGIITKMGGTIWVESELGKGSTFFVEVPQVKNKIA